MKGLSAGAATGNPLIAAGGAVVGGIVGAIGGRKRKRKAREAEEKAKKQYSAYLSGYNNKLSSFAETESHQDRINKLNNEYGIPSSFKGLV
jgi:hypothetical protein